MKKITLFFILTLLSFSSCKTTSKTIKIGNFTFSHTTYDSWSSKNVLDDTVGEFCLKGNGETKLHEYILGSYAIKGKIRIQNEEREVCFIVDTGAVGNVIKSDVIKSFKNKFERKYSFYSSYTYSPEIREDQKGLLDSIEVFGKECKNIPILAQSVDYVMIGEVVLRNFDIYLDYEKSKIYLNPVECNFSTRDMALLYTSNGNRYGGFGVNFARDKYNKRLRVASLYYIDNKKICKEMKIGDYVVSINGIPQEKFILEDLANLDKIEVELQRGKKTYKGNLNKNNFDNFGTY